jgi:hypothetical protein
VAVFAVFGLNTSVLISSKDFGAEDVAFKAARQVAGEVVSLWDTFADGFIDSSDRDLVIDSREDMAVVMNVRR